MVDVQKLCFIGRILADAGRQYDVAVVDDLSCLAQNRS